MSPYAKPKSREIGLKRSVICMCISLKLTQRRQVGRSRGKKGTFSLRKLPHKKRDVAKTQANSYVAPCIFSPWSPSHAINVPWQLKTSLIFSCKGQGQLTTAFCKMSVRRSKNCLEFSIECFHSRGQHLFKFIGTKESVCITKEFNSHRTTLGHQHGRRFIVLGHQYGRRDVMWKSSIKGWNVLKQMEQRVTVWGQI